MDTKEAGQVEISFTYKRHVGPKYIHGSVKIRFDSLHPYSFNSLATWPKDENYENDVREGVEKALLEITGSLNKTKVTLLEIDFDKASSVPMGFQTVAYAATYTAFLT